MNKSLIIKLILNNSVYIHLFVVLHDSLCKREKRHFVKMPLFFLRFAFKLDLQFPCLAEVIHDDEFQRRTFVRRAAVVERENPVLQVGYVLQSAELPVYQPCIAGVVNDALALDLNVAD